VDKPLLFDEEQTTGRTKKKGEKKGEKKEKKEKKTNGRSVTRHSTVFPRPPPEMNE
jgi:hypothetical protein